VTDAALAQLSDRLFLATVLLYALAMLAFAGEQAARRSSRVAEATAAGLSVREAAAAKMGFSAYGVTQGDDPVSAAMKGLIDNAGSHEHQITLLWQAIEKLSQRARELPAGDCVPQDAQTTERFDTERFNQLVK